MSSNIVAETAPEPGALSGSPARQRTVRLPRSPKILVGLGVLVFFILVAVIGPWVAPYDPTATSVDLLQGPSAAHLLGTTQSGQDVLSELLVGARTTVVIGFLAGIIATALSIVLGVSAGYAGGLTDDLLSLLTNVFLVIPGLPLLIVLAAYLPKSTSSNPLVLALIISVTGWAFGARVLRAQTLSLRRRDYVDSARVIGEKRMRIIGAEILPNLTAIVASSFVFTVLYAIGTYVALAFLGVVDPANWSWGGMLFWAESQNAAQVNAWWWFLPPGLCIALLGTSLALLNFGIDEFINPRLRAAGLSRKVAKRTGLPRRPRFGLTPVARAPRLRAIGEGVGR
ncbi:MAG TPA: ABC transporter permease [Pseudonocardiaceae bacterium]|jgi:peptide/nickel transport system permease protein|nr:ABC transporter permease [Pseudonocardiaceae bacterium]